MAIYFDNAATTAIKPPEVANKIAASLTEGIYGNPARGSHDFSLNSLRAIELVREQLKKLLQAPESYEVVFTNNATSALNMAIKGLIAPKSHVITTCWEHNAVLRPLYQMVEEKEISLSLLDSQAQTGQLLLSQLEEKITDETTTLVINHGSNVTGNVVDLAKIQLFCKKHDLLLIVDASQTLGQFPISLLEEVIDVLVFTGHKSLYGPTGSGGMCLKKDLAQNMTPLITGGDGIATFSKKQPAEFPMLLEAGTLNVFGILGLGAGIDYVEKLGIEKNNQHLSQLVERLISGIKENPLIDIYGEFSLDRTGVVSLNIKGVDSALVGDVLWEDYEIAVRSGYHCAPLMHKSLGTGNQGTVRFSFSSFNTIEEVDQAVVALNKLSQEVD